MLLCSILNRIPDTSSPGLINREPDRLQEVVHNEQDGTGLMVTEISS